jgi:anaerobic magnesium-protoporphyrin IX monomethyl ester cyclase
MKIVVGYPPLGSKKGVALLGQNRQFQWANTNWSAYPVVPAYAATMLKNAGHEVLWLDGINAGWTYEKWEKRLIDFNPDVLIIESKTPVINKHWKIINKLKQLVINHQSLTIILVGDHVTALPEESLKNSKADYVITGGNYDFGLVNLIDNLQKGVSTSEVLETNSCKVILDSLPYIDRDLTQWQLYAYKNSNYGRLPGTYTMFGRDCWYGKCTFCSWANTLYPPESYQRMSVKHALDEIGHILENYPVREIMDDSGTFPVGEWLRKFCRGMIDRGYNKKVKINCNMRFNTDLTEDDYQLMGKAGFRFLLYGLESANQKTLDKLDKNLKVEQIIPSLKKAKKAGLKPHITVMTGYPWETEKDVQNTLKFVKKLSRLKLIDSLQSTIIIPYPGTRLFSQAVENNRLKTTDWNDYDMSRPVLKTDLDDDQLKAYVRKFYTAVFTPNWLLMKAKEAVTNWDTFKYYLRFARRFFSKQLDFRGSI